MKFKFCREHRYDTQVGWSWIIVFYKWFCIGHVFPYAFGPSDRSGFPMHRPSWDFSIGKRGTPGFIRDSMYSPWKNGVGK
jgi:hypothetical protein